MIDADLAEIYGVSTKALNQAVKRNIDRFPAEFMFCLTKKEKEEVVTNCDHLGKLRFSPVLPRVFTEYGALMLARKLMSLEEKYDGQFKIVFESIKRLLLPQQLRRRSLH